MKITTEDHIKPVQHVHATGPEHVVNMNNVLRDADTFIAAFCTALYAKHADELAGMAPVTASVSHCQAYIANAPIYDELEVPTVNWDPAVEH